MTLGRSPWLAPGPPRSPTTTGRRFRVNKKIFATVPDTTHLNVMVDEDETALAVAVAESPSGCEELWWGKRLKGVRVDLGRMDRRLFTELLTESWRRRAPKARLDRLAN